MKAGELPLLRVVRRVLRRARLAVLPGLLFIIAASCTYSTPADEATAGLTVDQLAALLPPPGMLGLQLDPGSYCVTDERALGSALSMSSRERLLGTRAAVYLEQPRTGAARYAIVMLTVRLFETNGAAASALEAHRDPEGFASAVPAHAPTDIVEVGPIEDIDVDHDAFALWVTAETRAGGTQRTAEFGAFRVGRLVVSVYLRENPSTDVNDGAMPAVLEAFGEQLKAALLKEGTAATEELAAPPRCLLVPERVRQRPAAAPPLTLETVEAKEAAGG